MADNFPEFMNDLIPQTKDTRKSKINKNLSETRLIIEALQNCNNKERSKTENQKKKKRKYQNQKQKNRNKDYLEINKNKKATEGHKTMDYYSKC